MNNHRGFVLATVLVALAVIAVGATFLALWVKNLRDNAFLIKEQTLGELDQQATKATLLYLLATRGMTYGGLRADNFSGISNAPEDMGAFDLSPVGNEIKLDDTPYEGIGNALFSIQDEGGLMNINYFSSRDMRRFASALGVERVKSVSMSDQLLDYIDADSSTRIHGAESGLYRQLGQFGPANRLLASPMEVNHIPEWQGVKEIWHQRKWQRYTTILARGVPNVNTAPAEVLQMIDGIGIKESERIMQARNLQVITLADQVEQIIGAPISIPLDNVTRFTSKYLRVSIWLKNRGVINQIHLELTPKSPTNHKPWLIAYENKLSIWSELAEQSAGVLESPHRHRYLQTRNQILLPEDVGGISSQATWVLSRGNLLFYYIALDGVPVNDWLGAVDLTITEKSPYAKTGRYVAFGSTGAMAWIWNQEMLEQHLSEHQLPADTPVVPESLYYAPETEGVRLLETKDGFELQAWSNSELIESIYWSNAPDFRQLKIAQANLPAIDPSNLPPIVLPFDEKAWATNKVQREFKLSRPIYAGILCLAAIYFIAFSWQILNILVLVFATKNLQAEVERYKSQITEIIEAREAAFNDIEEIRFIDSHVNGLAQTRMLASVFEKIPRNGVVLQRWMYQSGELMLVLKGASFDPRYYVQAFESLPFISTVSAQPDQSIGTLTLRASVVEAGSSSTDIIRP